MVCYLVIKALRLDFVQKQPFRHLFHLYNVKYLYEKLCFFVALAFLLVNCGKDEKSSVNDCNTENPIEELSWLKTVKDSLTDCPCQISIMQGTYMDQTVYYLALTDPLCDGIAIPTLFNCSGKAVKQYTQDNYMDFSNQVRFDSVLYSCKNQ